MNLTWTAIPSGYDPTQTMGYRANVPGCRHVSVRARDVRCDGWNGVEWEVETDSHEWRPCDFSARGVARDLGEGRRAAEAALDLAVLLGLLQCPSVADADPIVPPQGTHLGLPGAVGVEPEPIGRANGVAVLVVHADQQLNDLPIERHGGVVVGADALLPSAEGLGRADHGMGGVIG